MNRAGKIVAASLLILSGHASAFDMNPIDTSCWGNILLCTTLQFTEKLKFPVHETMTLLAYDYYMSPDDSTGGAAKTSADVLQKGGRLRDLVIGSEWNDDPDSLLRQSVTRSIEWYALFNDAKQQAGCKINPAGAGCKNTVQTQNPMMLYRSHFGDLQFIHSMASLNTETAETTKKRMMAWAKFTYSVFISPTNLENEPIDGKTIMAFSDIATLLNKPGWTVGSLFDPEPAGKWISSLNPWKYGRYKSSGKPRKQRAYENYQDKISVRYIALGSLLHMIQDSYSDSHTEREHGCNPIARSKGKILSFRNYADQNADDHGIADLHPDWLENGVLKKNNPIWASAWIIQMAFDQVPWENGVEAFLDQQVFPLGNPQQLPLPGDRNCFTGEN